MIHLIKGDITRQKVDAVVNAANPSLMGGGGVDGAIHRAGGKQILQECMAYTRQYGSLPTGEAMITTGGNMPAKYVIHTVGPVWRGGNYNEDELLKKSYLNSLQLALQYGVESIAFPNISTGVYGFPKQRAARIALTTIQNFLKLHQELEVYLVCFDDENYAIYKTLLP